MRLVYTVPDLHFDIVNSVDDLLDPFPPDVGIVSGIDGLPNGSVGEIPDRLKQVATERVVDLPPVAPHSRNIRLGA
ncbi:hypothetical protein A5768_25865 [Mycolicibacterium fortuitum]|nr:hypothetical protein A5768_25865 [Mycolicibacterium fortuitum]